ncbi:MAG: hypothetical protein LBL18_01565 [Bacteroidales bacterium]|jgi:hypothetical protein|nr:hypothetical protein [Bacteroidales bacterium]
MKQKSKVIIICVIFFCGTISTQAQSEQDTFPNDTIKIVETPLGYQFKYQNKTHSYSQIMETMRSCPEAVNIMRISKNQNTAANLLGIVGGFGVGWAAGWTLGRLMRYGAFDTDDIIIVATTGGLGILFSGLTFYYSRQSKNNTHAAVKLFNRQATQQTSYQGIKLDVGLTANGIGLKITF